jgi:hypothetical protein
MATHNRRDVLKGIGVGLAAGGAGLVTAQDGEDGSRVRVVHASPDAPAVDVLVDGSAVLSGVSFGDVSDYLDLAAGTYTVKITATGDPDTVAFEGDVSVEADTDYTVAAVGELSEETFRPAMFVDDNSVQRGRARVRIVHASPDAPAVDVTVNDAETTLVDGLAFGDASGYLPLHPGPVTVEVRPDSESNDNPFDAEFGLQLRPNRVYTVFAEGYFSVDDEPTDEQFGLVRAVDAEEH